MSSYSCQIKRSTIYSESKFYTDSIYSNHLSEYRKHNVYLPKGFDNNKRYPIIYATDGSKSTDISFIKLILDSLIDNQIIKPTIYIGSHSNNNIADSTSTITSEGKKVYLQFRNFEYVNRKIKRIEDSLLVDRFQNHMLYFKDELIPKIENEFHQIISKTDRVFYGYSNGACFGANLLNKYPNLIGTYICFSTLGFKAKSNIWNKNIHYPNLYIRYGKEESDEFKTEAEELESKYKDIASFCELKVYNGGHDINKWNEEFTKTISVILKVK